MATKLEKYPAQNLSLKAKLEEYTARILGVQTLLRRTRKRLSLQILTLLRVPSQLPWFPSQDLPYLVLRKWMRTRMRARRTLLKLKLLQLKHNVLKLKHNLKRPLQR